MAYFFANLPLGFPNVLLGLGFLLAFIRPPLVLYGTIWILIIAYVVAFMPIAIRNIGPVFQQVGKELEEAARVSGASKGLTLAKITMPLVAPGLTSSAALLFILIFREFPIAAFISTPRVNVISMSLLNLTSGGQWAQAAALSLILASVSIFGVVFANVIASRFELIRRRPIRSSQSRPEVLDIAVK